MDVGWTEIINTFIGATTGAGVILAVELSTRRRRDELQRWDATDARFRIEFLDLLEETTQSTMAAARQDPRHRSKVITPAIARLNRMQIIASSILHDEEMSAVVTSLGPLLVELSNAQSESDTDLYFARLGAVLAESVFNVGLSLKPPKERRAATKALRQRLKQQPASQP